MHNTFSNLIVHICDFVFITLHLSYSICHNAFVILNLTQCLCNISFLTINLSHWNCHFAFLQCIFHIAFFKNGKRALSQCTAGISTSLMEIWTYDSRSMEPLVYKLSYPVMSIVFVPMHLFHLPKCTWQISSVTLNLSYHIFLSCIWHIANFTSHLSQWSFHTALLTMFFFNALFTAQSS